MKSTPAKSTPSKTPDRKISALTPTKTTPHSQVIGRSSCSKIETVYGGCTSVNKTTPARTPAGGATPKSVLNKIESLGMEPLLALPHSFIISTCIKTN